MANGGRIQYNIGFNVDQSGLNSMKTALAELRKMPLKKFVDIGATRQDFNEVKGMAKEVESVLKKSFNSELGSINLTKFNSELNKSGLSLQQIQQTFSKAGAAGNAAFRSVAAQLANVKIQVKQTNKFLDDMGQTFKNTIKWGLSSGMWNTMTNAIQGAFNYAKKLDTSLNDIRIVTGKSADEMERFAVQANKAAKNLGQSTTSYTNASLIYYQQGLEDAEVQARTETTLKAANVTGQSAAEVSEQLTAVWNGYKVNAEEAELYVDKLAAVAATTATDLEELSTGMSKVASAANLMGVDMDQLNAQLATIVSVTRQAPESVGTALKTIYARMGDIEAGIDTETTLGNYTSEMEAMGFNVLNANGELRDMGEVIEEIGGKWTTLSREQQVALSQTMAGTRQYNNLLSLFDNWDMYTEALKTSAEAAGTLQSQQDIYMESMEAHLQQLSTAGERVYNSLFNADSLNPLIDGLTFIVDRVGDLIDGLGGGGPTLLLLGSIVTRVFKKQIGEGISSTIINLKKQKENVEQLRASYQTMSDLQAIANDNTDEATKKIAAMGKEISKLSEQGLISQEDRDELLKYVQTAEQLGKEFDEIIQKKQNFEKREKEAQSTLIDVGLAEGSSYEEQQESAKTIFTNIETEYTQIEQDKIDLTGYEDLNDYLLKNNESFQKLNAQIDKQTEKFEKSRTKINQWKTAFDQAQSKEEKKSAARSLSQSAQSFLNNHGQQLETDIHKQLNDAIKNYRELKDNVNATEEDIRDAANAIREAYIEAIDSVEERFQDLEDTAREVALGTKQALDEEEENNNINQEQNQTNFIDSIKNIDLQSTIQTLTDMAGAATQVGMALFSLKSMFDVLNNTDLTFEEKISQFFMTLITIVPTLLTALPALKTGMIALAGALKITTVTAETGFIGATGAVLGFQTAIGPLGWVLLGITAAITGLVAAIHFATEAYNADAIAAEKAAEAAKLAGEAATETANAYKALADTMQGYDDAVNGLKELTKGTQEYQDALESANEKVIELISSNAELAQHVTRNADGLLVFKEDAKEEVLETARKRANMAQATSYLAQAQAGIAQNKSERTDLRRDIYYYKRTADGTEEITLSEAEMDKLMSAFEEKGGGLTEEELKNIEGLNERFIPLIKKNMEAFVNLTNETKALNITNKALKGEILRASLENNSIYADSTDAEKTAIATLYGEGVSLEEDSAEYKALLDKAEKEYADQSGDDSAVQKEYAKARGWTHISDGWGEGTYVDEEGNEQKVSDEVARTYLKQQYVTEQLANYDKTGLENITEMVKDISFASKSFDSSTQNEILGVLAGDTDFDTTNLNKEDFDKLSNMSKEAFKNMFSDVDFSSFEGEADEFIRRIQEGLKKADWSNYFDNLVNSAKKSLETLDSAIDEISEGNELDDDALKILEKKFPELSRIWDKTSNEYLEMLKKIQEQEEQTYSQILDARGSSEYEEIDKVQETYAEKIAALANTEILTIDEAYEKAYDEVATTAQAVIDAAEKAGAENVAVFMEGSGSQAEETIAYENARRIAGRAEEAKATLESGLEVSEEFKEYMEGEYNDALEDAWEAANVLHAELEDTFKNDYEFEISITEDLLTDVDNLITKAENAQTALASIGEGFIVSAEHSKELFNIFPELAHNAKVLADGAIQLDEDVTNSLLENEAIIIDGDTKRTATAIDHRIAELEADKAIAQAKLEELHNTSVAEFDVQSFLGESYQDFKSEEVNANALAAQDEVANSAASAQAVIANWQAKMEAAKQYAIIAQQAEAPGHNVTASSDVQSFVNSTVNSVETQNETQMTEEERAQKEKDIEDLNQKLYDLTEDYYTNKIASDERQIADLLVAKSNLYTDLSGLGVAGEGDSKNRDLLEEELDIFHDINIELELLANRLDLIASEQEKLTGSKLIDNLKQQLEIINKQADAQKRKRDIAIDEAKRLKGLLLGDGVTFNEDDTVSNYFEIMDAKLAAVNNLIASGASDEVIEAAEKNYEAFKEDFEEYEELLINEIPDLTSELQSLAYEQIEKKVEIFDTELQIELDLSDAERNWNDFVEKTVKGIEDEFTAVEDKILGSADLYVDNFKTYLEQVGTDESGNPIYEGELAARVKRLQETQAAIDGAMRGEDTEFSYTDSEGRFHYDEALAEETLQKNQKGVMDALQDMKKLSMDINALWAKTLEQADKDFSEQIEQYNVIADRLEHDMELIRLIDGENSFGELEVYYEQIRQNNLGQLDMLHQMSDFYWNEYQEAAAAGNEEAAQQALEHWKKTQEDLDTMVMQSIEDAQSAMMNSIDKVFDKWNQKLTGGSGLDYITQDWELMQKDSEQYLDTVNSIYGVQKLQGKYLKSIDDTDNLKHQQKLKGLMDEQISMLQEKDKLTEYDLKRAELRYELALKELALEEAKDDMSTMRLRRDAAGNYSYEYVANPEKTEEAEQEIADVTNELYNLDLEEQKATAENFLNTYKEYMSAYKEAITIQDEELRDKTLAMINERYGDILNNIGSRNQTAQTNLIDSWLLSNTNFVQTNVDNFTTMMEEGLAQVSEKLGIPAEMLQKIDVFNVGQLEADGQIATGYINSFIESTQVGVQDFVNTAINGDGGIRSIIAAMSSENSTYAEQYKIDLNEIQAAADTSFESIALGQDNVLTKNQALLEDNDQLVASYTLLTEAIQKQIESFNTYASSIGSFGEVALNSAKGAQTLIEKLARLSDTYEAVQQKALGAVAAQERQLKLAQQIGNSSFIKEEDTDDPGKITWGGNYMLQQFDPTNRKMVSNSKMWNDVWNSLSDNARDDWDQAYMNGEYLGAEAGLAYEFSDWERTGAEISVDGKNYIFLQSSRDNDINGWIPEEDLEKFSQDSSGAKAFDTGGYTGEWGTEGRLAILHQKEIVLNAGDTENLLSAVNIVRSLGDMVKNLSAALVGNLTQGSTPIGAIQGVDAVEQNVHITAEFPNVKNSNDIEQALMNLVNTASQRAFNTQR